MTTERPPPPTFGKFALMTSAIELPYELSMLTIASDLHVTGAPASLSGAPPSPRPRGVFWAKSMTAAPWKSSAGVVRNRNRLFVGWIVERSVDVADGEIWMI